MKRLLPLVFAVLLVLPSPALAAGLPPFLQFVRGDDPARTFVFDASGVQVATLTDGSRTAVFRGPKRTFSESAVTTAKVVSRTRVRLVPRPWPAGGEHDAALRRWLVDELNDNDPDVLDIAMQYRRDTTDLFDHKGIRYAGRAYFGPVVDGERVTDSDFTDYLGVSWTYPDGTVQPPDPVRKDSLDCSGFLRMVFGYRSGYPLGLAPGGGRLPREARDISVDGPGTLIIPDRGVRPPKTALSRLQPGDLVFFDLDPTDGPLLDHSGIFLGIDTDGQPRFISSRKLYNGPTMGDKYGASVLTGDGVLAQTFRLSRRI